jgi:hypothetical protein
MEKGKFCQVRFFLSQAMRSISSVVKKPIFIFFLPLNKQNNKIRSYSEPFLGVEIALKTIKFLNLTFFRFGKRLTLILSAGGGHIEE